MSLVASGNKLLVLGDKLRSNCCASYSLMLDVYQTFRFKNFNTDSEAVGTNGVVGGEGVSEAELVMPTVTNVQLACNDVATAAIRDSPGDTTSGNVPTDMYDRPILPGKQVAPGVWAQAECWQQAPEGSDTWRDPCPGSLRLNGLVGGATGVVVAHRMDPMLPLDFHGTSQLESADITTRLQTMMSHGVEPFSYQGKGTCRWHEFESNIDVKLKVHTGKVKVTVRGNICGASYSMTLTGSSTDSTQFATRKVMFPGNDPDLNNWMLSQEEFVIVEPTAILGGPGELSFQVTATQLE